MHAGHGGHGAHTQGLSGMSVGQPKPPKKLNPIKDSHLPALKSRGGERDNRSLPPI